ncbi:hypothetical protein TNCV_2100581 [Trichonephila clavipes]|nr:hypothetical protein TNCV_2100581 [Trichonephila clavipes]
MVMILVSSGIEPATRWLRACGHNHLATRARQIHRGKGSLAAAFEHHLGVRAIWLDCTPTLRENTDGSQWPPYPLHEPHESTCGSTAI